MTLRDRGLEEGAERAETSLYVHGATGGIAARTPTLRSLRRGDRSKRAATRSEPKLSRLACYQ